MCLSRRLKKQRNQENNPVNQLLPKRLGGQEPKASETPSLSIKEQKAELKKSFKKKLEEFKQVLMEDEEDDDLLSVSSSDFMKDDPRDDENCEDSQKSVDFGQALAQIQFGSLPPVTLLCNMILVLPKTFQAKPNQPVSLEGDVEDEADAIVQITKSENNLQHPLTMPWLGI